MNVRSITLKKTTQSDCWSREESWRRMPWKSRKAEEETKKIAIEVYEGKNPEHVYASLYLSLVDMRDHPTCFYALHHSGWCPTHSLRSVPPLPPSCLLTLLPPALNNTLPEWSYSNSVTDKKPVECLSHCSFVEKTRTNNCFLFESALQTASHPNANVATGVDISEKTSLFIFLETDGCRFNRTE